MHVLCRLACRNCWRGSSTGFMSYHCKERIPSHFMSWKSHRKLSGEGLSSQESAKMRMNMEQRSNTLKGVRNAGTCVSPMAEGENSLNCTRKRKSRILIVEDSPTQAQALRFLLVGAGFDVEVASDGQKGLDFFTASNLDLVISDILM